MFDEKVVFPEQFTVQERNRKSTDVCCTVIGAIFALTMFIVALTMWNKGMLNLIVDKFTNHFLGLRSGLGGQDCAPGTFTFSSDPNDYSVNLILISGKSMRIEMPKQLRRQFPRPLPSRRRAAETKISRQPECTRTLRPR